MVLAKPLWYRYGSLVAVAALAATARAGTDVSAFTEPSADVTLAFAQPGRIAAVHVKEGDPVTAGQLLIQQDEELEKALLAQTEARSKDTSRVKAAEATLEQKKVDLKKLEWAAERGSATELEVEHARLDVKLADLSLALAKFEHRLESLRYDEVKVRLEQRKMLSPLSGRVETVDVEAGESTNIADPVMRVVKTNPLWIDAPVPLTRGRTLSPDHAVSVTFPGGNQAPVAGKIIFIASVADAPSATIRVRVAVSNPSQRPAGERVTVRFTAP
jgi:RND family efflux transporter MFP subunit